ncbi:DNA (cytosine-5-)-methyltransferase [Yersinia sp. 2545 StPb PI]|uniref:DNA (cytosine-5-)-methyltransferase n=1 Tax=unclassified Yersinia (in: enterobacteria) TaxID=2653513 RepID=UPI003FA4C5CF
MSLANKQSECLDEIICTSSYIKEKRMRMGMTPSNFALLLDMKEHGERTVRGWESGEHAPSAQKKRQIIELRIDPPYFQSEKFVGDFTFIDLFAGIGGIRMAYQNIGGKCVFSSEWDKFAQKTYAANYGELPAGDITQISSADIPKHDILLGGFPCQAFSQAGLKRGFSDTRGTMFFEIQRILGTSKPKAFMLENVKQLRGHDKGRTLNTILNILEGLNEHQISDDVPMSDEARGALTNLLNYKVFYKVLRAGDFGVPQNRERIFIVGFNRDYFDSNTDFEALFNWPEPPKSVTRLGDILEDSSTISERYTISERLWAGHQRRKEEHKNKGNGFGYSLFNEDSEYANTLSARYYKDGSEILIDQSHINKRPRKLTPRECARLQGFPENFVTAAVSDAQIYKQFGNSVCIPVVQAVAEQVLKVLSKSKK